MNKQMYLAYLNTFTFSCIQMVLYTTIPYIAEKTGVVTSNIILAISLGSMIFAFMGPFWAARSDRLGRKRVLSFGMLGMMISFALLSCLFIFNSQLSLVFKITIVYISRIVYGLLASAIVPVSQAWQLDLIGSENHLKVLTRNSMCLNIGRVVGPVLILFKQINFELVIFAATGWVFLLSVFCFSTSATVKKEDYQDIKFSDVVKKWQISIKESFLPILLAMIFTSFVGVLHSFLGHHLKTVLDLSGKDATMMFAKIILILSILAVCFQQLSILLFQSRWRPRVIIGAFSIVIGTYLMMLSTSAEMIWLSILFISIATALIPPAYLSLMSNSKENTEKTNVFGKKLGIASISHSLGYAIGMGMIAVSMKMKLVPESYVVFLISFSILILSIVMTCYRNRLDEGRGLV